MGGILIAFGYLFWTGNALAPSLLPAPPDSPILTASLITFGVATLLLALGLTALILGCRLSGTLGLGGWLLVAGFLLWALGAVTSFLPVRLPWWFVHFSPLCILVGSAVFAAAAYGSTTFNRWGALLVGLGGAVGMLLIDGPELVWDTTGVDLAPGTVPHALGYLLLLAFGLGWIILGRARPLATGW
jgi:hypothetical protein